VKSTRRPIYLKERQLHGKYAGIHDEPEGADRSHGRPGSYMGRYTQNNTFGNL